MDRNDIKTKLEEIANNFELIINDDEEDFLMSNNVDSITFVDLVINIEQEFSILVSEKYMIKEKMNSISKIIEIIEEELTVDTYIHKADSK